ncbi:MAG: phosphoenolpyruvate--protein phosphotransferase [Alphaproteobacteria bacterium]|nr:phosphoenolpyruvate--protein phosphotransferase [Alphaproteobacteria bacterium]
MEKEQITKVISSRRLLKKLREVMSADISVQEKLNRIVDVVAFEMQTEVCSFYLLQPGDILELFASFGLKQSALHETSLRLGEGLIGEIAVQKKALSFDDVWHHPSFVFKPETGEKIFRTLMGVPVLQGTHLLGVLAVQTEQPYVYTEEEIETLETVAMLIGQILLSVDFKSRQNTFVKVNKDVRSRIEGVRLMSGMAIGTAFVHARTGRIENLISSNNEVVEQNKLTAALTDMDKALSETLADANISDENAEIFETYRMFTKDKGWIRKMTDYIHAGFTAEGAVQKVADDMTERMSMITDPYLKERIHDFQDLADRLLHHLAGKDTRAKNKDLSENTILVAHSMGPAELLDYKKEKIKGIILEEGSPTMHVVIIAKALNIPVVGGVKGVVDAVLNGDKIALDADNGYVYINPVEDILKDFKKRIESRERIRRKYEKLKNVPCQTKDGVSVSLNINAGLALDMLSLGDGFSDGIGLYRTELPFMSTTQLPDTQKQTEIYSRALLNAAGKPVVFRTLDIGSDKVLPYVQHKSEENPAMGWRSIRITLDRRTLLRQQLRAFIRAVNGGDLYVMFPMITDVDEFVEAKKTLDIELAREKEKGHILPKKVQVGTMLEVPSLIFQLEELLPLVDFLSIGTNDLSQFLFATDRSDPTIWERYDVLSAPMIRTLKWIVELCDTYNVPCSVCGEMAGKPLEAMVLVALGFKKLSMNAASLGPVKAMILSMDTSLVKDYLETILPVPAHSLREKLRLFAIDHDIVI